MEMKRLASDHHDETLRWPHTNLGLVAWYKYASEYGESYVRPAWCLGLVLFVFLLLYPAAGLHLDMGRSGTPASAEKLTYWRPSQNSEDVRSFGRARRDLVGHSFVTTLYVAAFQKDFDLSPVILGGGCFGAGRGAAYFHIGRAVLLAVRRQFKR